MDIRSRIISILDKEHYTFAQLAAYLQKSEQELTDELTTKKLELRNLEAIAKALRIPLYSLFNLDLVPISPSHHPYHINKLWMGNDDLKEISQLENEIALLKEIIALKEDQLIRRSSR